VVVGGEQPLPPFGSCLLGSINLAEFVMNPFESDVSFDWERFTDVVKIFTRMLDNVVEMNGLPLERQREEIISKRRHGMGFTGLGSALSIMGIKYGSEDAVNFADKVMMLMAVNGFMEGVNLAIEKGAAPLLASTENRQKFADSKYMERIWDIWPEGKQMVLEHGCRFTHHTSIAPTGTISLSFGNNVSNGVEPSFSHKYTRNVIKEGKKSKSAETVYSYEGLLWKSIKGEEPYPDYFVTTDDIPIKQHVDMQAAAQYWCDSSISKTINVPTDTDFEEFKDIYVYAFEKGLKGCTTFRFNPEAFQGVLVKDEDLENTLYSFTLEDGTTVEAKGNELIDYDGEEHTAANLYDSIKEGYFGRF
jgi:ribonucleoside-diphosphate reductase alpha chain